VQEPSQIFDRFGAQLDLRRYDASQASWPTASRTCPSTWQRLRHLKARWDPDNVFATNQNIPPA
jgi:hypothetical protein